MRKQAFIIWGILAISIILASFASALTISSINPSEISPGEEKLITIKVRNNLGEDVSDVSLNLIFANNPFIPVGSSEDQIDEILDGDSESFKIKIKASNDAKPGDYDIAYTLSYKNNKGVVQQETGTIGFIVTGDPSLGFVLIKSNPIVGQKGSITLKIVNSGFGDAKFSSVKIIPSGYSVLTEDSVYIGTIESDDFETASFDVIFSANVNLVSFVVDYTDFNNEKITKMVNLPLNVYTRDEALRLGIIQKSNTALYAIVVIVVIVLWIVYRRWKKARKLKKSKENGG